MAKKFEYPDMNNFKCLTRGCLVCGLIPPNMAAHGITPEVAVCDKCWVEQPEKAVAALKEAEEAMKPMEEEEGEKEEEEEEGQDAVKVQSLINAAGYAIGRIRWVIAAIAPSHRGKALD